MSVLLVCLRMLLGYVLFSPRVMTQVEAEQHASELIGRLIHHALVAVSDMD